MTLKKNDYLFIALCICLFGTLIIPLGLLMLTIPQQGVEWVGEPFEEGSYMRAKELHPTPGEATMMTFIGLIPTGILWMLIDKKAPFNEKKENQTGV